MFGFRELNLLIGWRSVDLALQRVQSEARLFDRVGERRLIGSRTVELRLHLVDVFALLGNHLAVAIVLGAFSAISPHADVELILHDAFAGRADSLDGFDLGLDTRDGLLHVAPRVVAVLECLDLDRSLIEQKAFDEIGDAGDLSDVKGQRLAHGRSGAIGVELGAAGVRIDDRVEMAQEGAVVLALKGLDGAAVAPLLVEKALPALLFEAFRAGVYEIGEPENLAVEEEEAEDILFVQ